MCSYINMICGNITRSINYQNRTFKNLVTHKHLLSHNLKIIFSLWPHLSEKSIIFGGILGISLASKLWTPFHSLTCHSKCFQSYVVGGDGLKP